jgi:lysozyme
MNYQGVYGFDVSYYNDANATPQQIDFHKMKSAGATFVIIRAGQNTWVDPDFSWNYINAKLAGLPRGVYWFYDDRVPPSTQSSMCLSLLGNDRPEMGVWLDLERDYGGNYKGWQNWKKFIETIKGRVPSVGIYTGPSYWMTHRPTGAADLAYFKALPLWIAHYGVTEPLVPNPWDFAILWQSGTPAIGLDYGVESLEIDFDKWNGSPESFCAYFGLKPTEGEPMYQGKTSMIAKVWDTVGGQQIKELPAGTVVKGDAPAVGYAHITSPVNGYTKTIWLINYAPIVVAPPPPPPPTPTDGFVASFDGTITITDAAGVKHSAHIAFDVPMVNE